jgi:hypothetical protein
MIIIPYMLISSSVSYKIYGGNHMKRLAIAGVLVALLSGCAFGVHLRVGGHVCNWNNADEAGCKYLKQ